MKTLSIRNPWGLIIAKGIKDVENRTWKTNFRGRILIHTSKSWDCNKNDDPLDLLTREQRWSLPATLKMDISVRNIPDSAIIGELEIIGITNRSKSIWAVPGQFHWILSNAKLYPKPILNVKGSLGLWDFDIKGYEDIINAK